MVERQLFATDVTRLSDATTVTPPEAHAGTTIPGERKNLTIRDRLKRAGERSDVTPSPRLGGMTSRGRTATAIGGSALLAVALLAACGSSSKSTSSPTTAAPNSNPATSSASGSASGTTGASAATGSPITIGVAVSDIGPLSIGPAMSPGIKGGQYYVNNVLGGVHGHPINIVMCNSDDTPATEVNCANNFVSKGVVAVDDSYDTGFSAEYPILSRAGIPIFGVEVADTLDDHAQNAYFFGPPEESFAVGPLQVFHQQGLNKLALTIANAPAAVTYVNEAVLPVAKKLGMNVKVTYFDASSINWSVVANSMIADNPQMTGIISSTEQDCNSLINALRTSGFNGPILMAGCSQYVQQYPQAAVNTYSYGDSWTPILAGTAPSVVQKQLAVYNSAMAKSGTPNTTALGQLGVMGFAAFPDLWYALEQGSAPYTTTSINTDLKSVTNFQSFMGPMETCNHTKWPGTSSCNNSLLMLKVASGDKWTSVYPGGFTNVDPSLLGS